MQPTDLGPADPASSAEGRELRRLFIGLRMRRIMKTDAIPLAGLNHELLGVRWRGFRRPYVEIQIRLRLTGGRWVVLRCC